MIFFPLPFPPNPQNIFFHLDFSFFSEKKKNFFLCVMLVNEGKGGREPSRDFKGGR